MYGDSARLLADVSRGSGRDIRAGPWSPVRLVKDDRQRRLDGACGGQQTLWVADPQHAGDCLTGHHDPTYASARAANGNPVQRRETFGPKEIQATQIDDQSAAPPQVPASVFGQGVSVGCIDVAAGADNGY
jgi:hypothetical protein